MWRSILGQEESNVIIKIDQQWGFAEFPSPGDVKKHLLPLLIDPEECIVDVDKDQLKTTEKTNDKRLKEFWMPDRYCKVCYSCEEAFTMYRRRHHCRMCGQVFCNTCSSYFIDGILLNTTGSVRVCRACYDQMLDQTERDQRVAPRKKGTAPPDAQNDVLLKAKLNHQEATPELTVSNRNLQYRASQHLIGIVSRLVDSNEYITSKKAMWKEIIVNLVKEVVSSVDPDVRSGDSLDIRPYVKIKVIPGGEMQECTYIDGVVFRKNVAHKKMAAGGSKKNPRILLLASGIEFQRNDVKLSSMDTLIEQEDKFMEILVEKIMSLKPDIILVGKAVARKAQELLCAHQVTVMQNVKLHLLERIARMTNGMLLSTTDNMIKQYGEECLGTCEEFWLRVVNDDPEKASSIYPQRVLRTRISRGSTYAYIQGCPSERGCSIVLRGEGRSILAQIKQIIRFSVVVAYHLRLEVAYYNDRLAELPTTVIEEETSNSIIYDDGSDVDDEIVDTNTELVSHGDVNPSIPAFLASAPAVKSRIERQYLSTSLEVDFNIPYRHELVGTQLFRSKNLAKFHVESHQTLLITSLMVGDSGTGQGIQRSTTDVKGIRYYTKHDIALGHFILENCFQLGRAVFNHSNKDSRMLDQTLSFVHRPGRIDITVRKTDKQNSSVVATVAAAAAASNEESNYYKDINHLPLQMSSYCKECNKVVVPSHAVSDETWKMSFGKFLEMYFYNRAARCYSQGCHHHLRDCHILTFSCENYSASFEFIPIHAYSLHVRDRMSFPEDLHYSYTHAVLASLPTLQVTLIEDFRMVLTVLEREIKEVLAGRPEDLALAMTDLRMLDFELNAFSLTFLEELLMTYEALPRKFADKENEHRIRNILTERHAKAAKTALIGNTTVTTTAAIVELTDGTNNLAVVAATAAEDDDKDTAATASLASSIIFNNTSAATNYEVLMGGDSIKREKDRDTLLSQDDQGQMMNMDYTEYRDMEFNAVIATKFPMVHMRNTYLKASRWNARIDTIYRFLDSVRSMLLQQQQQQQLHGHIGNNTSSSMHLQSVAEDDDEEDKEEESEEGDNDEVDRREVDNNDQTTTNAVDVTVVSNTNHDDNNTHTVAPVATAIDHTTDNNDDVRNTTTTSVNATTTTTTTATTTPHDGQQPLTSLYRAAIEHNRRTADKPVDKMSRITKALSRLLVGNKEQHTDEQQPRSYVQLGDFANGRFRLRPGRSGEVIPVSDDILASVIAYSLASEEYFDALQASIYEDSNLSPTTTTTGGIRSSTGKTNTSTRHNSNSQHNANAVRHGSITDNNNNNNTNNQDNNNNTTNTTNNNTANTYEVSAGYSDKSSLASEKVSTPSTTNTTTTAAPTNRRRSLLSAVTSSSSNINTTTTNNDNNNLSPIAEGPLEDHDNDNDNDNDNDFDYKYNNTYGLNGLLTEAAEDNTTMSSSRNVFGTSDSLFTSDTLFPTTDTSTNNNNNTSGGSTSNNANITGNSGNNGNMTTTTEKHRRGSMFSGFSSHTKDKDKDKDNVTNNNSSTNGNENSDKTNTTSNTNNNTNDNPMNTTTTNNETYTSPDNHHTYSTTDTNNNTTTNNNNNNTTNNNTTTNTEYIMSANEKQMLSQDKSNIRYRFDDYEEVNTNNTTNNNINNSNTTSNPNTSTNNNTHNGRVLLCKFQCQIYWAKQFEAVRTCYFQQLEQQAKDKAAANANTTSEGVTTDSATAGDGEADSYDSRESFIRSLAVTARWVTSGGKSGAAFAKTMDERMIVKVISKVELQMFLDFAPAYFEYMAKAYYHNLPTVLCKILGVYTVRYDNRDTGKKGSENVVVMENIFYQRNITRTFDLKGSSRARYVELVGKKVETLDELVSKRKRARRHLKFRNTMHHDHPQHTTHSMSSTTSSMSNPTSSIAVNAELEHNKPWDTELEQELHATLEHVEKIPQVLLDDNLMEYTKGRPFPLKHRAKLFFHKAVQNDTLFLSIVNVVDYSILVGFDDENHEVVVGIIDYLRQYDIIKKMERVGKGSVGMLTGQAEPTIIQPSQYRKRFTLAMDKYFMTVPDKWISYDT